MRRCMVVFFVCGAMALNDYKSVNLQNFGNRIIKCEPADCSCSPDYLETPSLCDACMGGSYKNSENSCQICPDNSFSLPAASSADECVCVPGYWKNGGVCEACRVNTYKAHYGNFGCMQCPTNFVSPLNSTHFEDCECKEGYMGSPDQLLHCIECAKGYLKPTSGSMECEVCPVNTYSSVTARFSECDNCPPNSETYDQVAQTNVLACKCSSAYGVNEAGECVSCETNYYCGINSDPRPCPQHSAGGPGLSNVSQCLCGSGYKRSEDQCTLCHHDSYCSQEIEIPCPGNSTSPRGSDSESDCVCAGGFERLD